MTKIIITFFLFTLTTLCPAQMWQKNKIAIDTLIAQKSVDKAQIQLLNLEGNSVDFSAEERYDYHIYTANFLSKNKFSFYTELVHLQKATQIANVLFEQDKQKRFELDWKIVSKIRRNGDYKFSLNWYKQNIGSLEAKYDARSIEITEIYSVFAVIMSENADDESASFLIEKILSAIKILEKTSVSNNLAQVIHRVGFVYYNFKNLEKAFIFYQKSIEIFIKVGGENSVSVAEAYSMLGETYNGVENADLGLENTLKALDIMEKLGYKDSDTYYFHNAIGISYSLKKDYENAEKHLEKAARYGLHYAWTSLGGMYRRQGKFGLAHQALDSSYQLFNYHNHLNISKLSSTRDFVGVLECRNNIFEDQYAKTQNIDFLMKREAVLSEINELALYHIAAFHQDFNKRNFYTQTFDLNNNAIDVCYELFERTHEERYLEKLLSYSEVNKSLLLLESILTAKKLQMSDVPLDLEQKALFLKVKILQLEKELFEKDSNEGLKKELFDYQEKLNLIKDTVVSYCKDYYKNDYEVHKNNVASIQEILNENASFIEYSLTNKFLYTILINKNELRVERIVLDFPLQDWIKILNKNTTKINENDIINNAAQLCNVAFELHQKLIAPIQHYLKPQLIIVPNGILDYLPFDILLSEPAQNPMRFQSHAYLIKTHSINYHYSANLWKEVLSENKSKPNRNLLALAPFFDGSSYSDSLNVLANITRVHFSTLPFSGEEVYLIGKIMNGNVLTGSAATKERVTTEMGNYRFLHFATHGKANDKQGEFSYIVLKSSKNINKSELLYVKEIYNIKLSAEMVVLSACETGIGEAQFGEGLISLARAFTYSGAKSVLTTLWTVNDEKTKDIMVFFYENLKKSQSKDEALQQAKLKYLDLNKNLKAHPYYWAGFKFLGNNKAI